MDLSWFSVSANSLQAGMGTCKGKTLYEFRPFVTRNLYDTRARKLNCEREVCMNFWIGSKGKCIQIGRLCESIRECMILAWKFVRRIGDQTGQDDLEEAEKWIAKDSLNGNWRTLIINLPGTFISHGSFMFGAWPCWSGWLPSTHDASWGRDWNSECCAAGFKNSISRM